MPKVLRRASPLLQRWPRSTCSRWGWRSQRRCRRRRARWTAALPCTAASSAWETSPGADAPPPPPPPPPPPCRSSAALGLHPGQQQRTATCGLSLAAGCLRTACPRGLQPLLQAPGRPASSLCLLQARLCRGCLLSGQAGRQFRHMPPRPGPGSLKPLPPRTHAPPPPRPTHPFRWPKEALTGTLRHSPLHCRRRSAITYTNAPSACAAPSPNVAIRQVPSKRAAGGGAQLGRVPRLLPAGRARAAGRRQCAQPARGAVQLRGRRPGRRILLLQVLFVLFQRWILRFRRFFHVRWCFHSGGFWLPPAGYTQHAGAQCRARPTHPPTHPTLYARGRGRQEQQA